MFDEQLRLAYEAMACGVMVIDGAWRLVAANRAAEQILGAPFAAMRERPYQFTRPDGAPLRQDEWPSSLALRTGQPQRNVLLGLVLADGARRVIEADAVPVSGADGSVEQVVISFIDVTERTRMAEALRAKEEWLQTVVMNAPIILMAIDAEGIITVFTGGGRARLGVQLEDRIGKSIYEVHAERPFMISHYHRALAGEAHTTIDHIHGEVHEMSWLPQRNAEGAITGVMALGMDVSARARVQHESQRAREAEQLAQLRTEQAEEVEALAAVSLAFAGALDPTQLYEIILEQAVRVIPCSCATLLLYTDGWATVAATWGEPGRAAGTRLFPLEGPDSIWLPTTAGVPTILPDTALEPTWRDILPRVGEHRVRSLIGVPIVIDGVVLGCFGLYSPRPNFYGERHVRLAGRLAERVTLALRNARLYAAEQERARAAEELARLRDDFVASVSHELRTPLTAIVGYAELLQDRWPQLSDARRLDQIGKIVFAANRQQRLVEDLLLLSRLELGALAPKIEPAELWTLVQRAADEVRAGYRGQLIDLDGPRDLLVQVDTQHAVQVLVNLLDNAAKYSPECSPIVVTLRAEAGMAEVRVRDQGSGLSAEGRRQLFTRFGRVSGSRTRAGRVGTGLGLYLSRRLAEAMSGDLDLEDTGPSGSTFLLRLPRAPHETTYPPMAGSPRG